MTQSNMEIPGYALPILFFRIADTILGTELKWIREVVTARQLTPLPNSNNFVAGVVNIRGDVISVLDTASLLHIKSDKEPERILLLDIHGAPVGLAVQHVISVQAVMPEAFSTITRTDAKDIPAEYISGITSSEKDRVPLLNIPKLISHIEDIPQTGKRYGEVGDRDLAASL